MKKIFKDALKGFKQVTENRFYEYNREHKERRDSIVDSVCEWGSRKICGTYDSRVLNFYGNGGACYYEQMARDCGRFTNESYWIPA